MTEVGKKLLDRIWEEINSSAPDLFKPTSIARKSEERIGVVTDPVARKIYGVAMAHRRDENMAKVEAQYLEDDDDNMQSLLKTVTENDELGDLFMMMFWLCVRHELGYWLPSIGIRKGWIVVVPAKHPHPLAQLFGIDIEQE